jgi:hypothetical protein
MLPLPIPQQGGSVNPLTTLCNLSSEDDLVLVVAWLVAALRHGGPYPLLVIAGEQGSAKTALSKMLRALIDPNAAPVERDLFVGANNAHVLAFDNLSFLPAWVSDALCRLASGGAFAIRQLYSTPLARSFSTASRSGHSLRSRRPRLISAPPAHLGGAAPTGEGVVARIRSCPSQTSGGRSWMP